jgi:hypothetical protein
MPLSYVNPSHREPSAYAGVDRVISQPGLARPSLNLTGGRRRRSKKTTRRSTRSTRRSTRKHGGFYPSVMGSFVQNATRLVPAVGVTGYRMLKNYKKRSTRKNRK